MPMNILLLAAKYVALPGGVGCGGLHKRRGSNFTIIMLSNMAPPTYESNFSVFSDEPLTTHRLVDLLENQTEDFKEKVEDIKEVVSVKDIEISGKCMESLNDSIKGKMEEHAKDIKDDIDDVKDTVIEGFENIMSIVLDMTMERVTLKTNGPYNAICGTREEPSLESKLNAKIEIQTEEIKSMKRKLEENNELLTQIIKRLGHITR